MEAEGVCVVVSAVGGVSTGDRAAGGVHECDRQLDGAKRAGGARLERGGATGRARFVRGGAGDLAKRKELRPQDLTGGNGENGEEGGANIGGVTPWKS